MLDDAGNFIKVEGRGATEPMWQQMLDYAQSNELKGGNFKKLNLPFENKLLGQPKEVRDRMAKLVEEFVQNLLVNVFNAKDTADLAIDTILEAGSYDPGAKMDRIEDPDQWTREKIMERAASITSNKGPEGDFDD
jgi:fructose-bisphosphate aldolase class II